MNEVVVQVNLLSQQIDLYDKLVLTFLNSAFFGIIPFCILVLYLPWVKKEWQVMVHVFTFLSVCFFAMAFCMYKHDNAKQKREQIFAQYGIRSVATPREEFETRVIKVRDGNRTYTTTVYRDFIRWHQGATTVEDVK
jgi:hypothetical protein